MADNIPLFPNETNLETFRDFVNLQKELNDHLLMERKLYEKIGRVSLDVEARVVQRRRQEFNMMKQIRDKMLEVNILVEKRADTTGVEREELERVIKATLDQIKNTKTLIAMSREANDIEMEMAKKKHEENTRWFTFASKQMTGLFGVKMEEFEVTKSIGEELVKQGIRGEKLAYTFGAVLMMLKGAYKTFLAFDKAAWEFRKAMGMSRDEAAAIRKTTERMTIDFMAMGVTIDSAYKSIQALGKVFGGVHNISQRVAENVALMAAQMGVSEDISAGFLRNLAAVSKNTIESQQYMMGFAQAMTSAGGVPLGEVMKDVATKSSTTLTMMSRLPNLALKSAIELRRMGTSLDQSARASRHLLDFTENVNEEMEASVLLGRSINLQRARELAYRRDIEGSTKEILRITKSISFEKLDPFQQEAFARATGRSVDELMNLLQTSKQIEQVRRSGTPEAQKQLRLYEQMHNANVAAAKAQGQNIEAMLRTRANQERIVAIQAKWNQLLTKAQEFLFPIIDKILAGALYLADWAPQIMMALTPLGKVFEWLGKIINVGATVEDAFSKFGWWVSKSIPWLERTMVFVARIGVQIGKWMGGLSKGLGFFGKFLGFFGKFLGPIGWVITAFQFIGNLIDRFSNAGFVKGDWIGNIWKGLKAIGGAIYDTLLKPFVEVYNWIMKHLGANSPSEIGLKIVKGMVSVGSMLFKAITAPYKMAFDWVINKFGGIGKLFGKLLGKGGSIENKAQEAYVPAITVTPTGTKIHTADGVKTAGEKEDKDMPLPMSEETGCKIVSLLEKILAKDVNIHMDGQLLSTSLARQTEFLGGYGVNDVS